MYIFNRIILMALIFKLTSVTDGAKKMLINGVNILNDL